MPLFLGGPSCKPFFHGQPQISKTSGRPRWTQLGLLSVSVIFCSIFHKIIAIQSADQPNEGIVGDGIHWKYMGYDSPKPSAIAVMKDTLWLSNIAMENGPFIDGLPIKNCDFPRLC